MATLQDQTKVLFEQTRQGYRPGKRSVWDDDLGHFTPGPESSERERVNYAQWLEVVAGTRVHTDATEQAGIIDRMLSVEFATKTTTSKPVTPPEAWESFLGEHLPSRYLDRAAQAWAIETDGKGTRWAKCAMRSINGCRGRVLYDRANPSPDVACDVCGHNPHGGFASLHAEAAEIRKVAGQ